MGFVGATGAASANTAGVSSLGDQRPLGLQQGFLRLRQRGGGMIGVRRHGAGLLIGGEELDGFGVDLEGALAVLPAAHAFAAGAFARGDVGGAVASAGGAGAEIAGWFGA